MSGIAEILAEKAVLRKWRTLRETARIPPPSEPLFLSTNGAPMPVLGDPDPRFGKYGLLRPRWEPREVCQPPAHDRPGNLLCTLRALFGVNARAEIVAWLLTHEVGHAAAIARDTGYFSKSIQATLNEMEASGQIRSERDGREKKFRIQHKDWAHLITWREGREFPRWIHWPSVFYFAFRTLDLLGKAETPGASDQLWAIQQRGFLDEIAPALRESRLRSRMTATPDLKGARLTDSVLHDTAELGRLLETDFAKDSADF